MNITQNIIKQMKVFPSVTKEQAYRLVKSYSYTSFDKFHIEFTYLINKGIISATSDYEFKLK